MKFSHFIKGLLVSSTQTIHDPRAHFKVTVCGQFADTIFAGLLSRVTTPAEGKRDSAAIQRGTWTQWRRQESEVGGGS